MRTAGAEKSARWCRCRGLTCDVRKRRCGGVAVKKMLGYLFVAVAVMTGIAQMVAKPTRDQFISTSREELSWQHAFYQDTFAAYLDYLSAYPRGRHVKDAEGKLAARRAQEQPADEILWRWASHVGSVK